MKSKEKCCIMFKNRLNKNKPGSRVSITSTHSRNYKGITSTKVERI